MGDKNLWEIIKKEMKKQDCIELNKMKYESYGYDRDTAEEFAFDDMMDFMDFEDEEDE